METNSRNRRPEQEYTKPKSKRNASIVVWLRRIVQTLSLTLFLYLFLQTVYHPINETGGHVTLFFELDPLVLLTVWLATHAAAAALFVSLMTLVLTMLFGRWFCGWVCPFGTLHNSITSLRRGRLLTKLQIGGYSGGQKLKYYVLAFVLGAALVGCNVAGWLDPLSLLYRSLATVVFPAVNLGIRSLFGLIYESNPRVGSFRITDVSEPLYELLCKYLLAVEQPRFLWGALIGMLFGSAVALNLYRARFWCRFVCPLGALLGIAGKNPLLRLSTRSDLCNECSLCLVDCQGGADPHGQANWKPSECFYCWNCHSSCPTHALSFDFQASVERRS